MYFYSSRIALASTRARKLEDGEYDEVREIITFLAQKEKMPMPELYVIESDQPNAFRNRKKPKKFCCCCYNRDYEKF